jgi:phosphoribosyl-AMP cyclohydrolase
VAFNKDGLVPVIAQDHASGEVLMMAWMNEAALLETITTRTMVYYSRSRAALWRKGETSGQVQKLIDLRIDCDGDTVLARVEQTGVACHTGRRTCFYRAMDGGQWVELNVPRIDPNLLYPKD